MAVNHKDTYKASAIFLIVMGILYLVDKLIGFASYGLPWVMQKDNLLLYAAVIFLWFKTVEKIGEFVYISLNSLIVLFDNDLINESSSSYFF